MKMLNIEKAVTPPLEVINVEDEYGTSVGHVTPNPSTVYDMCVTFGGQQLRATEERNHAGTMDTSGSRREAEITVCASKDGQLSTSELGVKQVPELVGQPNVYEKDCGTCLVQQANIYLETTRGRLQKGGYVPSILPGWKATTVILSLLTLDENILSFERIDNNKLKLLPQEQKSVNVMQDLVYSMKNQGDLVFDLFTGFYKIVRACLLLPLHCSCFASYHESFCRKNCLQ